MNRRDALSATIALLGVPIIGSELFLSGCSKPEAKRIGLFTDEEITLLDEIGETIIPATEGSPGAKAAMIGNFMKVMVTDCYDEDEQKIFIDGLMKFNTYSKEKGGDEFIKLTADKRQAVLIELAKEAKAHTQTDKSSEHYFSMIKQLTVWGYFTSEPGATKALHFIPIPGKYEGCIEYNGEPAWLY